MAERDVIYLKPGDPPPGSFEPDERGLRVWQGPSSWRTVHGQATVHWLLGRPHRIEGAVTPDGILDVQTASPMDRENWRRRSPSRPNAWVHGTVEIRDDGVAFTDRAQPAFEPYEQGDVPSLAADLSRDGAFLARLQDRGFAHAVYESLRNADYRKGTERRRWSCSWRSGGGLVADLRQLGESYIDFYLADMVLDDGRDPEPHERAALYREVLDHYARLGWRLVEAAEIEADNERGLADLAAFEAREEGPCPDWAARYPARDGRTTHDRAIMAARSGKVPEKDFHVLMDNLAYDFDAEVSTFVEIMNAGRTDEAGIDPPDPGTRH